MVMKKAAEKPEEWMRKRFPCAEARHKADAAVDVLDEHLPMTEFIDVWIQTYDANAPKKGLVRP